MAPLTEEPLNKFNKPDLVAPVLSVKNKTDSVNGDLVADLRKIMEGFDQIKSVCHRNVTNKVNT